jgi:hypothetical protein
MIQSSFLKRSALRFSGLTKPDLLAAFLRLLRGGSSDREDTLGTEGEREARPLTVDIILFQKEGLRG